MRRGDIWWAVLPRPVGSEPGLRHPLLVVQADAFTISRIGTVIAVVITSNMRLADAPGNVLLPVHETGLPRDSVANVSQVVTTNKRALSERVGRLGDDLMAQVDDGLRLVLNL